MGRRKGGEVIAHACRGTGCWCASPPGTDPDITRPDGTPVLVAPACPHGNAASAYCVLCLRGRVAELEVLIVEADTIHAPMSVTTEANRIRGRR